MLEESFKVQPKKEVVKLMSNQQIHQKLGDAAKSMQRRTSSCLLSNVKTLSSSEVAPRFCKNTRTDYNRALFEAALTGNVKTLNALAHQCESTNQLIDETACDNALWVAVAENQGSFAMALLEAHSISKKITMPGVKEAMKLSMEKKDKALITALLKFVADAGEKLDSKTTPRDQKRFN